MADGGIITHLSLSFLRISKMAADPNVNGVVYSEKYTDDVYEYRHVILPQNMAKHVPRNHLMTETEWRNLGVQQSPHWVHYMVHIPEPHVLLYRRHRDENVNSSQ